MIGLGTHFTINYFVIQCFGLKAKNDSSSYYDRGLLKVHYVLVIVGLLLSYFFEGTYVNSIKVGQWIISGPQQYCHIMHTLHIPT